VNEFISLRMLCVTFSFSASGSNELLDVRINEEWSDETPHVNVAGEESE
jgi:hypothetical protein